MKKLLIIASLAGAASLSFGQGYVGVDNTATTKISSGGKPIQPTSLYYLEILIAPTTVTTLNPDNPLSGGWLDSTIVMTNVLPGRFVGSNDNYDPLGGGAQVPSSVMSYPAYPQVPGMANFAVIGWSANLGPTLADALDAWNNGLWNSGDPGYDPGAAGSPSSGYMGISSVALDVPAAPFGGPYNGIWGLASYGGIPGMNLLPIPEPATFALGGLGAAALALSRRRK